MLGEGFYDRGRNALSKAVSVLYREDRRASNNTPKSPFVRSFVIVKGRKDCEIAAKSEVGSKENSPKESSSRPHTVRHSRHLSRCEHPGGGVLPSALQD